MLDEPKILDVSKILQDTHDNVLRKLSARSENVNEIAKILNTVLYPKPIEIDLIKKLQKITRQKIRDFSEINYNKIRIGDSSSNKTALIKIKNEMNEMNKGVVSNVISFEALEQYLQKGQADYKKELYKLLKNPNYKMKTGTKSGYFIIVLKKYMENQLLLEKDLATTQSTIDEIIKTLEKYLKDQDYINFFTYSEKILEIEALKSGIVYKGVFFKQIVAQVLEDNIQKATTKVVGSIKMTLETPSLFNPQSGFSSRSSGLKFTLQDKTTIDLTEENFNPWTEREGKTDVTLETSYNTTTNISAKNWSDFYFFSEKEKDKLEFKGFNTPNFIYSMIRTLQIDDTILWGRNLKNYYTVNTYSNRFFFGEDSLKEYHQEKNMLNLYHQLGRYVTVVDAIMGYSQNTQFAQLLVINVDSRKAIYVASIKNLLINIYSHIRNFQIEDYEEKIYNTETFLNCYDDKDFLLKFKMHLNITMKDIKNQIQFYARDGIKEKLIL